MKFDYEEEVFCPDCGDESVEVSEVFIDGYPHNCYTCSECRNHWDTPITDKVSTGIINRDGVDEWVN